MNRVMISELGFPALLVGLALAFEQFVSPSRVLFGQLSDAVPIGGRHRLPYIWMGASLFCALAVLSVPLIFHVGRLLEADRPGLLWGGIAALCGLFSLYGLAVSMASTPYLALVIMVGVVCTVLLLTLIATFGMERPRQCRPTATAGDAPPREDAITLSQAWALVTSSRQVLVFFLFLVLFTLGLFLQDPILESYGAEVFGMPIAATASLNAIWGIGTLIGLLLAGVWIVPRFGKLATARLGCQLIAASLLLLLLAGTTAQVPLLQVVMFLFGVSAGIGTNSALVLMLDLTLPEAAGTFVGVWGLAQAMSRALGKVFGGGLLDLGRFLADRLGMGSSPFPAYALVLSVEVLVALGALLALSRVNLRQFREDTGRSLTRVLSLEIG